MRYNFWILIIFFLGLNNAFSNAPIWVVQTGLLNHMTIYGHVKFDGVNVSDGSTIAAFNSEGDCLAKEVIADQGALNYYMVIGGDTSGESISFKLYDISIDEVFYINETIIFESDETVNKELNITENPIDIDFVLNQVKFVREEQNEIIFNNNEYYYSSCKLFHDDSFIVQWYESQKKYCIWPWPISCHNDNKNYFQIFDKYGKKFSDKQQLDENNLIITLSNYQYLIASYSNDKKNIILHKYPENNKLISPNYDIQFEKEHIDTTLLKNGNFVITWVSYNQDGSDDGIFGRLYGDDYSPISDEFKINQYYKNSQNNQKIADLSDGGFVVVWESMEQDGSKNGIFARKFNAKAESCGNEFQVNSYTQTNQYAPDVVGLSEEGFAIVWKSEKENSNDIYVRQYNDNAAPVVNPLLINTENESEQSILRIYQLENNMYAISVINYDKNQYYLNRYYNGNLIDKQTVFTNEDSNIKDIIVHKNGNYLVIDQNNSNNLTINYISDDQIKFMKNKTYYNGEIQVVSNLNFPFPNDNYKAYYTINDGEKWELAQISSNKKQLISGYFSEKDVDIQFLIVNLFNKKEYYSPKRSLVYFNPESGMDIDIQYTDGFQDKEKFEIIQVNISDGHYRSFNLYEQTAFLENGQCSSFQDWNMLDNEINENNQFTVDLEDNKCYRFKVKVKNVANNEFEYTSESVLKVRKNISIKNIEPMSISHGNILTFSIDPDNANEDFTFSAETNPKPIGELYIDPDSGAFFYTPDEYDKQPFQITFFAESNSTSLSQTVTIIPKPDLPSENYVFGMTPSHAFPSPESKLYIFQSDIKNDSKEYFNHSQSKIDTYTIQLAGKTIVFQKGNENGLYESYHDRRDMKNMEIYAEKLIIRDPLHLPQTNLTIYAREIIFEDIDEKSYIQTTPISLNTNPGNYTDESSGKKGIGKNGAHGLKAGDMKLYIERIVTSSNDNKRFILSGGKGQNPGKGQQGANGQELKTYCKWSQDTSWCNKAVYVEKQDEDCEWKCSWKGCKKVCWWDFEWSLGTKQWPTDGEDAMPAGKPGNGGNAGNFTSSIDLSEYVDVSGGISGEKAPDRKGGKAGKPQKAYWVLQEIKKWSEMGSHEANAGKDAPSPSASIPIGKNGKISIVDNPMTWLHPMILKNVLLHAKDAYLYGYTDEVNQILTEYNNLLEIYENSIYWDKISDDWQIELQQMSLEVSTLLHRIDNHLDYFGNPSGYVPMLSFEVNFDSFRKEIERAVDVLYLTYWLNNSASNIENKRNAISSARNKLTNEIQEFSKKHRQAADLIPLLESGAKNISDETEIRQKQLLEIEQRLIDRAEKIVEDRHKVPKWKKACRIAGAICQVVPVYQPALGTIGQGLNIISQYESDNFMSTAIDLAKISGNLKFSESAQNFQDQVELLDYSVIENDGIKKYAKNIIQFAKPMGKKLNEVKNALRKTETPRNEIEIELQKIKATDKEFNQIVDKIAELIVKRENLVHNIGKAMQEISSLSNNINHNLLSINQMNFEFSRINTGFDVSSKLYLNEMEKRAKERLLKYQYYMAKAYEYRMLKEYKGDMNLVKIYDQFKKIAETSSDHNLTENDIKSIMSVYEDELSSIIFEIFMACNTNDHYTKRLSQPFKLDEETTNAINNGEIVKLNLMEEGLFQPDEENVRIVNIYVINPETQGSKKNKINKGIDFSYFDLCLEHSGISMLRKNGQTYLFKHFYPNRWEFRYQGNDIIRQIEPSPENKSLLKYLIDQSNQDINDILMYSRPSAWSDILISKKENPNNSQNNSKLDEVWLQIEYDYESMPNDFVELKVNITEQEVNPLIEISEKDHNGRQDGIGSFRRIFIKDDIVKVKAPENHYEWKFEKWIGNKWKSINKFELYSPTIEIKMDDFVILNAHYIENKTSTNHFQTIWQGNPFNSMTLWISNKTIENLGLVEGDEIAIFDGDKCVGVKVLDKNSFNTLIDIVASQDDNSGNGFTEDNKIYFKLWDSVNQIEKTNFSYEYYDVQTNQLLSDNTFSSNEDRTVILKNNKMEKQTITLNKGWNIVSFSVMPDNSSIDNILQPVIDDGSLLKVIDEQGKRLIYSALTKNWINQIGNINNDRGYLIKVDKDVSFSLNGNTVTYPVEISLSSGWNIIGYSLNQSQNALDVFSILIDTNELEKVIDEKGNRLLYSALSKNWINQIGELSNGKGYQVKVNNDSLIDIILKKSNKKNVITQKSLNKQLTGTYCDPVWSGNPYGSMNFWIVGIENYNMQKGDELCVFDDDNCVGSQRIENEISYENILTIITSKDDGTDNGFKEGNPIRFKLWDSVNMAEIDNLHVEYIDINNGELIQTITTFKGNSDIGVLLKIDPAEVIEPVVEKDQLIELPVDITATNSEKISIPVYLHNPEKIGIEAIDLEVQFDNTVLSLSDSFVNLTNSILEGNGYSISFNANTGKVAIYAETINHVIESGILVNLEFDVIGNAGASSEISFSQTLLNRSQFNSNVGLIKIVNIGHTITGNITYYQNNYTISDALIKIEGENSYTTTTDSEGQYTLFNILPGNYKINISKIDELGGISGEDASKIAAYAVDLDELSCQQQIAGDVLYDNKILSTNAARVAQYATEQIECFTKESNCRDWYFIKENTCKWPKNYSSDIEILVDSNLNIDFQGIRFGDVTGNWTPINKKQTVNKNKQLSRKMTISAIKGSEFSIPIVFFGSDEVRSSDLKFEYDKNNIAIKSMELSDEIQTLNESPYNLVFNTSTNKGAACVIYTAPNNIQSSSDELKLMILNIEIIGQTGNSGKLIISDFLVNENSVNKGGFFVNNEIINELSINIKKPCDCSAGNFDLINAIYLMKCSAGINDCKENIDLKDIQNALRRLSGIPDN